MSVPHAARAVSAIVVGTSAGGVDALVRLLPALQPGLGVPVLVVVHIPRQRPSKLHEIFGSRCLISVVEVEDKQPLEPDTVYFAPPDYHFLVDQGPIACLSSDEPVHYSRPSIDVLFQSAADLFQSALLAIVLTGANEDGAAGLQAAERAGGLTMVQDPDEAAACAMPRAALHAAPQSLKLGLDQIAAQLRQVRGGRIPHPAALYPS